MAVARPIKSSSPNKPPKKPRLVKDFWPRLRRKFIWLVIIFQMLAIAALAAMLTSAGLHEVDQLGFIAVLVAQGILGVSVSVLIYFFVIRPGKYLLAALTHTAGELSTVQPPNPNEAQFARNGMKPVLQTIYQLAADDTSPAAEEATNAPATTQTALAEALDKTICGFAIYNRQRRIVYANKATPIRMDANGVQSLDLLFDANNTIDTWWDECERSAVHAQKTWARVPSKLPNEEDRRYFDIIATYDKGTDNEVIVTLIDRTNLYKVGEEELDFIAFAAHELRGPITVIRGYIDVLQDELDDTLDQEQKELFRRLEVSANRLSGYINNILNTSRYDRRHLRLRLSETTLAGVYNSISDDMALRASSQRRLLTVDIPDGLPSIAADSASLGEVMSNLIDNAIKYSNEGGTINVTGRSLGDTVEFSVEDRGIGMPSSVVSNLFQKFYRSYRSRESVAGTGIGLYISKAIIESHGGTISVRSEDGHGSTFTVSLPTYATVADKLRAEDNKNEDLINKSDSRIQNHTMTRG